jgi:guanylate kinase
VSITWHWWGFCLLVRNINQLARLFLEKSGQLACIQGFRGVTLQMAEGKIIIFSAPSGAGKTTIVRHLLAHHTCLQFSISATTRPKRSHEVDGKDYYFLSVDAFRQHISQNNFVEHEEVYNGLFYGTLKAEIERIWQQGCHALMDVDVKGGLHLKTIFGEKALSIFVKPPSLEILKERLEKRNTESEERLVERIRKAAHEMTFEGQFDRVLMNNQLDQALQDAEQMVMDFIG